MISGMEIAALVDRATRSARRRGKRPFVMTDVLAKQLVADPENFAGVNIPSFGDYVPGGWTAGHTYFVDKSGFGADGEPALTLSKFMAKMTVGKGYAMTQEGQFQAWVTEFTRKEE